MPKEWPKQPKRKTKTVKMKTDLSAYPDVRIHFWWFGFVKIGQFQSYVTVIFGPIYFFTPFGYFFQLQWEYQWENGQNQ